MASEGEWPAADPRRVPLDEIDADDLRFRITTRSEIDPLAASIGRLGLLQPLLLRASGRRCTIVSGFRRVAACRQLGWREIPARVLSHAVGDARCARLAIGENALVRPLNLLETARALALLVATAPDGRLPAEDAAALALPSHAGLAARLMGLERLPAAVREGLLEGVIALAMAEALGRLAPDVACAFARLFRELGLSLNRQREIVSLVTEIAARERRPALAILSEPELEEILRAPEADRGHKARLVRRRLHRRRFPAIRRAEENFESLRRRLDLGEHLQLTPSRDFEGTHVTLTLTFETLEELSELRGRLDALLLNPSLRRILEGKAEGFAPEPPPPAAHRPSP